MSETLGEKLRQAREARGLSISDVAEQTRISALYLSCIENDDYRTLPGGIFNKGFVKSFAKVVGVDEQEALQDYARLIASQGNQVEEEPRKTYRSEVLTDESNSVLNAPTIIGAIIILALMTGGILFLLNYLQKNPSPTVANTNTAAPNVNTNVNAVGAVNANSNTSVSSSNAPSMNDLKVEFKALNSPVSVTTTVDGKGANPTIKPDQPLQLEPKQALRIKYSKSQSSNVQLTINNKAITLPANANPGRGVIEFEIKSDNLPEIWSSGQIAAAPPAAR